MEGVHLNQILYTWWSMENPAKVGQIAGAIPAMVMWELWKRKNARRHGKEYSYDWMVQQCQKSFQFFIKERYPWIREIPTGWADIIDKLKTYRPKIYYWEGNLIYVEGHGIGVCTNA